MAPCVRPIPLPFLCALVATMIAAACSPLPKAFDDDPRGEGFLLPCATDDDCQSGFVCGTSDTVAGLCTRPCLTELDCPSAGRPLRAVCESGTCVTRGGLGSTCENDDGCAFPNACIDARCTRSCADWYECLVYDAPPDCQLSCGLVAESEVLFEGTCAALCTGAE